MAPETDAPLQVKQSRGDRPSTLNPTRRLSAIGLLFADFRASRVL
jgi:hypothetical protein